MYRMRASTTKQENIMEYQVGQEVVSTDDVIGVPTGTVSRITDIDEVLKHSVLYEVMFEGGQLRYLYESEFKLK